MTNQPTVSTASGAATFARYGLAASAIAFPVLLILAMLLAPSFDFTLEGREYVQAFANEIDGQTASMWLWPFATLLGVPALLAAARVARSRAPGLGLGGLILGFGFVIPAGLDLDEVIYASLKAGFDVDTTYTLVESVEDNVPSSILGMIWFLGLIGLVMLGVAILRGKSAPTWVGVALAVGPVAIPLTWFSGVSIALIAAWVLLGIGFAGCALVLVRTPTLEPAYPALN